MRALTIIAKRLAFGFVTAWAVFTTVFLAFTTTGDWVATRIEGEIRMAVPPDEYVPREEVEADIEEALAEYAAARGMDRPLHIQYRDWMGDMLTLQWGRSWGTGEEVYPLVTEAVVRSATYVLPGIALAVVLGMGLGLLVAMYPDRRATAGLRIGAYLLFALPVFWLGGLLLSLTLTDRWGPSPWLFEHGLPIAFVTMALLGGYVSYARAHGLEYASAEFVTLLRAKGAGPVTVTRHVLRNAAVPLFAMLFTEVLGLLVLAIFVIEMLFGIQGFGLRFFFAIDDRDLPVLLGSTIVLIVVGVFGNVIQDLSYHYLDPRVAEGDGDGGGF